ncbi:MAG TPA: type II toxin-antitoxin system VapC family toxin, partial [Pirellulaceae bacterium]|nr:type II toxin-antitoxin system VapC family toxin [Pirellulaceae bacterium]
GIVVDSSVIAKWVLPEDDDEIAERLLDTAELRTALIALDLALVEVANAIWRRHRRRLLTEVEANESLQDLFKISLHIEPAARLIESGLHIAIKYDRAIYDALFVALVAKTGVAGLTADEPLYNAVRADYPSIMLLRDWK